MLVTSRGNIISDVPDLNRWFCVASNKMHFFEIGLLRSSTLPWLQGDIVPGDGDFVFNGKLFVPGTNGYGTIIDNFPVGPIPDGWVRQENIHKNGFRLVSKKDRSLVLFGFEIEDDICTVTTNLYDANGRIFAKTAERDLILYQGPARFGRHGILIGESPNSADLGKLGFI